MHAVCLADPGVCRAYKFGMKRVRPSTSPAAMDSAATSCTQKLWAMTPIGAAWTETMQLGACLEAKAREEYVMEVQSKNMQLAEELGMYMLHLQVTGEQLQKVQVAHGSTPPPSPSLMTCWQAELQAAREKLDGHAQVESELKAKLRTHEEVESELVMVRERLREYERREREEQEQDRLAIAVWGCRRQADASWDAPPVLLTEHAVDKPITIGQIARELGMRDNMQRLSAHVHQAYMRAHRTPPALVIYYDNEGLPERVSCFTERDRGFITDALKAYTER
jgi:hypothetical protein